MNRFQIDDTLGSIMTRCPTLSSLFDDADIDYCCGGKRTLAEACQEKGLDAESFATKLEEFAKDSEREKPTLNISTMSLTELVEHIEKVHHSYLQSEFPRLDKLTEKVLSVHGERNARLHETRALFLTLSNELLSHMTKEERILFPMIRELEASETMPNFHCGSLANPIRQMDIEHNQAGVVLKKLREITDNYTAPAWACESYEAMLDGLAHLEQDLHLHIHKESNSLFPRAIVLENEKKT